MRLAIILILLSFTSGCAQMVENMYAETSFTLAEYPTNSGCPSSACKRMDAIEAKGYELARSGKISWVKFVTAFYSERDKLFPNASDTSDTKEYIALQRVLAEQMDAGKITEAQWVYLLQSKKNEQENRRALIENSRPRSQNCTSQKVGLPPFERWETKCN